MRKNSQFISIAIALLMTGAFLFSGLAAAQDKENAKSSGYSIGVIDIPKVMAEYKKMQGKYKELETEVAALQKPIEAKRTKIDETKKALEENAKDMSPEERVAKQSEVEALIGEFNAEYKKSQQYIDSQEKLIVLEATKEVRAAITKISEAGNYHLVLNAKNGNGMANAVLYFSTTIDITSQVLVELNGK